MNGSEFVEARRIGVANLSDVIPAPELTSYPDPHEVLKGEPASPGFELPLQEFFSKRYR